MKKIKLIKKEESQQKPKWHKKTIILLFGIPGAVLTFFSLWIAFITLFQGIDIIPMSQLVKKR